MSDAQYNLDRLNVLVLDDNRNMRALLESILFALGVRHLHEAHDVKQAFRDLQYFHADIVITDWQMEPLNGLDFVRMVRSGEESPNPYVPIIMLTGHTELHRVCEARDAGVNEFLAKPISAKALYSRVASIIEFPRPFIRTKTYFGPCRRRRNLGAPRGMNERREGEIGKPRDQRAGALQG
jgi:DNA-binding response OmpR family regulator